MRIDLVEYRAEWPRAFERERQRIESALAAFAPDVEHIGSTSVPGLCAKPTLDILVGLTAESQLDQTVVPMQASGFTYFRKYEPAMPYRRLFARLEPVGDQIPPRIIDIDDEFIRSREFISAANIHTVVKASPHWKRHIAFRDLLRVHPTIRDEYADLKRELALHEFEDTNDYNRAKDAFIKRTQEQALVWYDL